MKKILILIAMLFAAQVQAATTNTLQEALDSIDEWLGYIAAQGITTTTFDVGTNVTFSGVDTSESYTFDDTTTQSFDNVIIRGDFNLSADATNAIRDAITWDTNWNATVSAIDDAYHSATNLFVFRAYATANQSIADDVETVIQLNAESYDPASVFNTSTYQYIPTQAGYYYIAGSVCWGSIDVGNGSTAYLSKNGTIFAAGTESSGGSTGQKKDLTAGVVYLNGTTDYVQLTCLQDDLTSDSRNTDTDEIWKTAMWGFKISD